MTPRFVTLAIAMAFAISTLAHAVVPGKVLFVQTFLPDPPAKMMETTPN